MSVEIEERDRVEELAEEFVARTRRGDNPSIAEYQAILPDSSERVRAVLETLLLLEGFRRDSTPHGDSARRPKPLELPERLGDFRLIREIGRGGMGVVCEAVHESLERRVALKIMHANSITEGRA